VADKLASLLYPRWLYLTLARLTGEMAEYRRGCGDRQSAVWSVMVADVESDTDWWNRFQTFMTEWVRENRDRGDKIPETKSNQVAAG
jgi:hypothetical protein